MILLQIAASDRISNYIKYLSHKAFVLYLGKPSRLIWDIFFQERDVMDNVSRSQSSWSTVKQAVKHAYQLLCQHPLLLLFGLVIGGSVAGQQLVMRYNPFQQGFTLVMIGFILVMALVTFLHFLFIALVYTLIYRNLTGSSMGVRACVSDILSRKGLILIPFTLLSLVILLLQPVSALGFLLSGVIAFFSFFGLPLFILEKSLSFQRFFRQTFTFFKVSIVPFLLLLFLYFGFLFLLGLGITLIAYLAYFITSPMMQFSAFCANLKLTSLFGVLFVMFLSVIAVPMAILFAIVPTSLLTILYHQNIEKRN